MLHLRPRDYDVEACHKNDKNDLQSVIINCFAMKQAIESEKLSHVIYVSQKLGLSYKTVLYDQEKHLKHKINKALAFNDLEGVKYIFNGMYLNKLYNEQQQYKRKISYAIDLVDIEGIKYIYAAEGQDYQNFYNEYFENNIYAIEFATKARDIDYLNVLNCTFADALFQMMIVRSYYEEALDISEALLSRWIEKIDDDFFTLIMISIIRSNHKLDRTKYETHIEFLCKNNKILSNYNCKKINSLISTMFEKKYINSEMMHFIHSSSNIVFETVSNFSKKHPTIDNLLKITKDANSYGLLDFFTPEIGINARFIFANIDSPYRENIIYVPFEESIEFFSAVIHESAHAVLYLIFNNNGYPYKKGNETAQKEYSIATNKTISNIFLKFFNSSIQSYKINQELLLNAWRCNKYMQNNNDTLELFYLLFGNYSYNLKSKTELLDKYHTKIANDYNWNSDVMHILCRIQDYLTRTEDEKHAEFIVRVPELYAYGISYENMEVFSPIEQYLGEHVIPYMQIFNL